MNEEESTDQQSVPDFGDLLDAYDLNNEEGSRKDVHDSVNIDVEKPYTGNMESQPYSSLHQTDAIANAQVTDQSKVTTAAEISGTNCTNLQLPKSTSPGNEQLTVNVEESSLQTLSRFVEELSSPRKEVDKTVLSTLVPEKESTTPKYAGQNLPDSSSCNKEENLDHHGQAACDSESSSIPTKSVPIIDHGNNEISTQGNDVQDNGRELTVSTNSSTETAVTFTSIDSKVSSVEHCNKDSSNNSEISGITSSVANTINDPNITNIAMENSSVNQSLGVTNDNLLSNSSSSPLDTVTSSSVALHNKISEENSVTSFSTQVNDSVTSNKNVISSNVISQDNSAMSVLTETSDKASESIVENDKVTKATTVSQHSSNSSNDNVMGDGVVSVSVSDDGRQTFHCMDEDTDQIISFHIENVPDVDEEDEHGTVMENMLNMESESNKEQNESERNKEPSVNNDVNRNTDNIVKRTDFDTEKSKNEESSNNQNTGHADTAKTNDTVNTERFEDSGEITVEKGNDAPPRIQASVSEETPVLLECLTRNNRSNTSDDRIINAHPDMNSSRRHSSDNISSHRVDVRRYSNNSEGTERTTEHQFNPLNFSVQSSPSSSVGGDAGGKERPGSSMSLPSPKSVHSFQSSNPSPVNLNQKDISQSNKDVNLPKSSSSSGRINKRKRKDPVRSQNYSYISSVLENPVTTASVEPQLGISPPSINPKPMHVKEERHDKAYESPAQHLNPFIIHDEITQVQPRISNVKSLNSAMSPYSQFLAQNVSKPAIQPAKTIRSRPKPKQKPEIIQQHFLQQQQQQQPIPHSQSTPINFMNSGMYSSPLDNPNMRHSMRNMNYQHVQPINIAPEGPVHPPQGYPRYFPPPSHPGTRMPPNPYSMQPPPPYNAYRQPTSRPYFYDPYSYNRSYRPPPPSNQPPVSNGSVVVHHPPHRAPFVIRPDSMPPSNPYQVNVRPPIIDQQQNIAQQTLRNIAQEGIGHIGALSNSNFGSANFQPNANINVQQPQNNNRTIIVSPSMSDKVTQSKTSVSRSLLVVSPEFTAPTKTVSTTSSVVNVNESLTRPANTRSILPKASINSAPAITKSTIVPKPSVYSKSVTPVVTTTESTVISNKSTLSPASEQLQQGRISSEILKEQPVPTYKPIQPPASLGFKEPLKTFKCQGCGDEFLFSTSLVNHLERKTMFINYSCEECGKFIAFYNRCCLFIHAKSHAKGAKAYRLNINLAYIKVLPESYMPKIDKTHLKSIENSDKSDATPKSSASKGNVTANSEKIVSPKMTDINSNRSKSPTKKMSLLVNNNVNKQWLNSYNPNFYTVLTSKNKRFYRCLECKKTYGSLYMYVSHFNGKMAKTPGLFKCSKCLTDVVGVCASSAHMRVHSKEKPYVCPECGEFISGTRDIFLKHLKQKCIHFQRTLLMRCTICNSVVLFDPETVAKHYMESHYSKYYKCLECPMAFKTTETFGIHKKNVHKNKAESKLICKCALCDTVFHQMDNVQEHFKKEHWPDMSKHSCFTAFKCTHCTPQKLFNNRNAYSYHVIRMHGAHIVEHMCNVCGAEFNTELAMKIHRKDMHNDFADPANLPLQMADDLNGEKMSNENSKKSSTKDVQPKSNAQKDISKIYECIRCNTILKDQSTFDNHMAKHRFVEKRKLMGDKIPALRIKKLKVDELSNSHSFKIISQEASEIPVSVHEKETDKQKKGKTFVGQVPTAPMPKPRQKCSECEEKFFYVDEVQEHLKMCHGITPQYSCHLCGNTYESQEMTERHIQVVHEGKSKDHPYLCWICLENNNQIKGYGSWKMLEKHFTGHHKMHKNNIDYSRFPKYNGDVDSDSVASKRSDADLDDNPVKRLKLAEDSTFSCAKCKYKCDNRSQFVEHIMKHKLEENDIQCLECGLCFAVLPSLKRHLFMVHKIRDFIKYQQESGVDVESTPHGGNLKPLGKDVTQASPIKTHISQIPNGIAQPNLERYEKKKEIKKITEVEEENPLECNVCYKVFEDDNALRKHMRMHGMAFIRSRRAQVPAWE